MQELASKYDIVKVIGHGGFSAVFKARLKADPAKIYALKQLDIAVSGEESKEYRDFKEEVEILKRLNHPNIVKVYNEYILDGKPALEMEFIDGETLESLLKKDHYFSIDETLEVIRQIASALNYCHHYKLPVEELQLATDSALYKRNAIVHNDINPKNIVRTTNRDGSWHYVLIDFGLSFTDPVSVRNSKKEDGMAEYKAPEKWDVADVDTPSDIYSFGIVIYELLSGKVPFPVSDYKESEAMAALQEKHKRESVPDLCEQRNKAINENELYIPDGCDIPDWLIVLVNKCLEKQPQQRFKTGRELEQFLEDGLDGKIDADDFEKEEVISIDPRHEPVINIKRPYIEVAPNILTEAQRFNLENDHITIGRWNDTPDGILADIAIKTADKFISKNHCQISRREDAAGKAIFSLQDNVPSKNGTYYNAEKNTTRLPQSVRVILKDGDYFWIGNTKIIFHE